MYYDSTSVPISWQAWELRSMWPHEVVVKSLLNVVNEVGEPEKLNLGLPEQVTGIKNWSEYRRFISHPESPVPVPRYELWMKLFF